ncbi:MAG: hypothetical protein ACE5IY_16575 [bacterium]
MRFTDWVSLEHMEIAPSEPGLFQLKVQVGLLQYPLGKSAMFYYGYAEHLAYGLEKFRAEILPALEVDEEDLLVRWITPEDTLGRFKNHMDRFCASFGSLPLGNEALLQKRSDRS